MQYRQRSHKQPLEVGLHFDIISEIKFTNHYNNIIMSVPSHLKYTKDHEWIAIDGDIATVGITDFAQGELGDIVYVEVETVDETLEKDEVFGTVEAVKTVSDLFLPLSGKVIEFNESLESDPEKVNSDPYGEGWMIKMRITDTSQIESLLDDQGYKEVIGA